MVTATVLAAPLHVPVPVWVPVVSWACLIGLAVTLALLARKVWRRRHRPKVTDASRRQHERWVAWVASRWVWDAQNLGLALVDDTTRHRRSWWTGHAIPPVTRILRARFWPAPNGVRAVMDTLPGIGIDQVAKMADHLANAWAA